MIYYLTGQDEEHLRTVLTALYEAAAGAPAPVSPETGRKEVPQNDGRIQFHYLFSDWVIAPGVPDGTGGWTTPPILKAGAHCALGIVASPQNPQGQIGPNDTAMLLGAGIDVLRADQIDTTYLPKFQ